MKKKIYIFAVLVISCFTLFACGGSESNSTDNDNSKQTDDNNKDKVDDKSDKNNSDKKNDNDKDKNDKKDKTFDPSKEELAIYDDLFNLDNKVTVTVTISDEEIQKIEKDYITYASLGSKSPIYRMASKVTFTVGDKSYDIEEVGIRLKGNTSRRDLITDGRYYLCHFKLSFNETFDNEKYYGTDAKKWDNDAERKARKNRTFASLNGMELKWNSVSDTTYSCEVYAHDMFQDLGVLAANNTKANMNLGGINFGVYTLYEPVDETFIMRNLSEEDWGGDLYKAAWTNEPADYTSNCTYGVENEDTSTFYNYDLKTNKKTSQHESFKNLISVLSKNDITQEEFEAVIDTEYFINFAAVAYFIGEPDDIRNNFNNHYVYFRKSDGKAIFIPYDNDRTLGLTVNYNPSGQGMTNVNPFTDVAVGARRKAARMFTFACTKDSIYLDKYKECLEKVANSKWMTYDNFVGYYNTIKSHFESDAVPTHNFHSCKEEQMAFDYKNENLNVNDYMTKILATYRASLQVLSN